MPQAVRDAVIASAAAWEQYPDALCRKLRRAAAAFMRQTAPPIPEDWFVFGNGASGYFICSCLSDSAQTGDFAGTRIFGV